MIYVEHPPIQEKNNYVQEEKAEIKRIPNVHQNEEQENVDNNTLVLFKTNTLVTAHKAFSQLEYLPLKF